MLGVCVHEGHHIFQYEYIGPDNSYGQSTFGMLGFEGPAPAMMDMLFTANDATTSLNNTARGWMNGYLNTAAGGSNHDDYFWGNNGYESALFWKYLTEQFGSTRTEPQVGVDVIRRFYQLADENRLGISTTIQDVLDEKNRWSRYATGRPGHPRTGSPISRWMRITTSAILSRPLISWSPRKATGPTWVTGPGV